MPNIQPITREQHAHRRWQRPQGYRFAAGDAVVPLTAKELPKALMAMPIALVMHEGAYSAVGVLGLQPGKNLFVSRNGRWIAGYLPAVYKAYPFALANAENGAKVLCINEDSGLVSDSQGETFLGDDGQLNPAVAEVFGFLTKYAEDRIATLYLCALLKKHDLILPWSIKLQDGGSERNIEGLYRIDEAKLNQLPPEAFAALRDAGALLLAYCQLLSMHHMPLLGQLAAAHAQAEAQAAAALPVTPEGDLDLSFLSVGGTVDFGGLY